MGENIRVERLTLSTSAHSTEDEGKVEEALLNVLPSELRRSAQVEKTRVVGHYGNPIVIMRLELKGDEAHRAFRHIVSSLDDLDKRLILSTLDLRLDEGGRLYLRLSKQDAYLGRLMLYEGDDIIKLVVKLRRGLKDLEDVRRALSEFMELEAR